MPFLGTVGTLSIIILFFVLARLSERFGAVVRMRPLYRHYYLALGLTLISASVQILAASAKSTTSNIPGWVTAPWFILMAYHIPLVIALTIGVYVTWHYWSWLITERIE
jgi:hypothetical protein